MIDPQGWKWGHVYDELRQAGWSWKQAAYIAWASSPVAGRNPATLGELCTEVLGLKSHRIVSRWKRNNPEIEKTIFAMQAAPLMRYRADAFDALRRSATSPDYRHSSDRRLFFTMTGDLVERSEVEQRTEHSVDDHTAAMLDKIYGDGSDDSET